LMVRMSSRQARPQTPESTDLDIFAVAATEVDAVADGLSQPPARLGLGSSSPQDGASGTVVVAEEGPGTPTRIGLVVANGTCRADREWGTSSQVGHGTTLLPLNSA
jgi:hypothetical protein